MYFNAGNKPEDSSALNPTNFAKPGVVRMVRW
jgi:hypothetical protein